MKKLDEIWQEHVSKDIRIGNTVQDLIFYIENDHDPQEAISIATDIIIEQKNPNVLLSEIIPYVAQHLDSEDDFISELTVGCLVDRIKSITYAEKALLMAKL